MKVIKKDFDISFYGQNILDDIKKIPGGAGEDSLPAFLDIETTGISPAYSQVYLVGTCYPDAEGWHFIQWFCDDPSDEREVLRRVWDFCHNASVLVHFNGDRFDIPFLEKRAQRCRLEADFLSLPGFDLIKPLRLAKPLLKLPDGKLKTWERFLGIGREDMYNGGELIDVYKQYIRDHDEEKLRLLLLHNEEDILAMPNFLPALAYTAIAKGRVKILDVEISENAVYQYDRQTAEGLSGSQSAEGLSDRKVAGNLSTKQREENQIRPGQYRVEIQAAARIPQPLFLTVGETTFYMKGDRISLTLPVFSGTMKYFFPNPKDYYYLPAEDEAIHKSVGSFVDKAHREQATAKTAYTHYTADFLPCFEGLPEIRIFYPDDNPQASASASAQSSTAASPQADGANDQRSGTTVRPQPYAAAQELQARSASWWERYLREFLAQV